MAGTKKFYVDFDSMESGSGVVDLAIRIDVNSGNYEYVIEENGVPTTIPYYQFVGLLMTLINHSNQRFWENDEY